MPVKSPAVFLGQLDPPGFEFPFKAPQLHPAHGRKQVAQMVPVALMLDVELPTPGPLVTFFGIPLHPQQPGILNGLNHPGVRGDHRPPFPAGDIFQPVKTETGQVAEGADLPALIGAAEGMGRVFNHPQAMAPGKVIKASRSPGLLA